jgi:hypothetical protein
MASAYMEFDQQELDFKHLNNNLMISLKTDEKEVIIMYNRLFRWLLHKNQDANADLFWKALTLAKSDSNELLYSLNSNIYKSYYNHYKRKRCDIVACIT